MNQKLSPKPIQLNPLVLCFWLIYLGHFLYVWYISVDLPYWDEWYILTDEHSLLELKPVEFIFKPLFESRISWTYLQVYIFNELFSWNVIYQTLFNFLLFGLIIYVIIKILHSMNIVGKSWLYVFCIPILTPFFWEAHGWSQQSHTHFTVLFSYLLAFTLFFKKKDAGTTAAILIILPLLVFSWGRGAASALAIMLTWLMCVGFRSLAGFYRARQAQSLFPDTSLLAIVSVSTISLLVYFGILVLDPLPINAKISEKIFDAKFYNYMILVNSLTFGYADHSLFNGVVAMLFFLFPPLASLIRVKGRLDSLERFEWFAISLLFAWLLSSAAIALARSDLPLGTAKSSRYAFAMGLILPVILCYYVYLLKTVKITKAWLVLAVAACLTYTAIGYLSSLRTSDYHHFYYIRKLTGENCIRHHFEQGLTRQFQCPTISFLKDMRPALVQAQDLNLSFINKLERGKPLNSEFRRFVDGFNL